jgi:long-chain fatty acid transport protein
MFRKAKRALYRVSWVATTACLSQGVAHAEGFRNPPPGTFSLARAGGRIAQVDNAEASYHNPANIVDVKSAQIEASPTFVYLHVEEGDGSTETIHPFKYLPNAFFTVPLVEGKLAAGLSVTTPFGLSNEWDRDKGRFTDPNPATSWRYNAPYFTELMTVNANPSISWRVNDRLSVGAGLDLFWSQITLKQLYPALSMTIPGVGTFTSPESNFKAQGDGLGLGANAGVTFNLTEKQRLALTYRSPFSINYDGTLRFDDVPLGASKESDFNTKVRYPTIVSAGYGIELTDAIRLETDIEWIEFSRFQSLNVDAGANNGNFPEAARNIKEDWDNTFTAGIAGDWKFAPNWVARAGYQYYDSPVPEETFSPTIPDSNQHAFTLGLGYSAGHHTAELSYGYIKYDNREISRDVVGNFNGSYSMNVHLIAAAYAYSF